MSLNGSKIDELELFQRLTDGSQLSPNRQALWSFRRRCKAQHTAAQNAMSRRSNQKYPALESQVSSTTVPFICLVNSSPCAPPAPRRVII